MHTEQLQDVRPGRVFLGWFVAAAVTSFLYLALVGLGIVTGTTEDSVSDAVWAMIAVALGFGAGGGWTGWRAREAPILHGIAIGLVSIVAWFVVNVVATLAFPDAGWTALTPSLSAALILLQMAAAVAGARSATRAYRARAARTASTPPRGG